MLGLKDKWKGLLLCLATALPSWFLGKMPPIVGGAVIAIMVDIIFTDFIKNKGELGPGTRSTSKKVLQWTIILLGFGMNLSVALETGRQSPPIILSAITISLAVAFVLHKIMHIPSKISTLMGVGSSIRGGPTVVATMPVIDADNKEVTQATSVISFFNVLVVTLFPMLGKILGFDATSGNAPGVFAGTTISGTPSVTAAVATWDGMWKLSSATLGKAVAVKLTRTLIIIPITLVLAFIRTGNEERNDKAQGQTANFKDIFLFFILYSIVTSIITTIALQAGIPVAVFQPVKELSKFFIVLAMTTIGLSTDLVKLIKVGGKPIFIGACCWVGIMGISLML